MVLCHFLRCPWLISWIVLILVLFERSLHSAQVSGQSWPWPWKNDDVTRGRRTWIRTGGSGTNGLRYGKSATKTCNLFCNIAAKRVEKRCCAFYHPRIKPVLQQIKLLQVERIPAFDWTKLRASHAIHGSYVTCCKIVCLGPVKRATCTDFVSKSRTTLHFLQQLFATCNNFLCCKTWVVKRATAMFQNKLHVFVSRFTVPLRWCYTERFATKIFCATRRSNVGTILQPFETM